MTLLEMVQNIASAIESDNVNSITDTVEAYQIAVEIKTAYYELLAALKIPSERKLILLDGLVDLTKPNYLKIPDTVKQIDWFKYDYQTNGLVGDYVEVQYLDPDEFIRRITGNQGMTPSGIITDFSGAKFTIITNQNPTYWTTFDNKYIVTDSYLSASDTTLQQSKSLCWGESNLTFTLNDGYVPILDDNLFPLLLAESKSACFANIKQMPSAKDEQRSHRQLIRAQNGFWRANQRTPYERVPNYGRVSPNSWPFNTGTDKAHS